MTDAIFVLNWLFLGGRRPPCMEQADINGNGGYETRALSSAWCVRIVGPSHLPFVFLLSEAILEPFQVPEHPDAAQPSLHYQAHEVFPDVATWTFFSTVRAVLGATSREAEHRIPVFVYPLADDVAP